MPVQWMEADLYMVSFLNTGGKKSLQVMEREEKNRSYIKYQELE